MVKKQLCRWKEKQAKKLIKKRNKAFKDFNNLSKHFPTSRMKLLKISHKQNKPCPLLKTFLTSNLKISKPI